MPGLSYLDSEVPFFGLGHVGEPRYNLGCELCWVCVVWGLVPCQAWFCQSSTSSVFCPRTCRVPGRHLPVPCHPPTGIRPSTPPAHQAQAAPPCLGPRNSGASGGGVLCLYLIAFDLEQCRVRGCGGRQWWRPGLYLLSPA